MQIDEGDVRSILANPFYCLRQVAPIFCEDHEPMISEAQWVKAGVQFIKEYGAEEYLLYLLANLKGDYATGQFQEAPTGYKHLSRGPSFWRHLFGPVEPTL